MFAPYKSVRCERLSNAALMIAQALVWAGVTIAVALEVRGTPAAESVTEWMWMGAFTSLMLASLPALRRPRGEDRAC